MENKTIEELISWIKNYVQSAHAKGVVLGMSGGKDSLVVAKLCALALGEENVFGVIMPNGEMADKNDAEITCKLLNIPHATININEYYTNLINKVETTLLERNVKMNDVTTINTPPRLRMTTLYALAGSLNYLVANTSNLSEISVGYSTKWGDSVGDFAPLADFTKTEVCKIGLMLGLPDSLVNKLPSDGLSGKSDEDKMGLKYKNLDSFIRTGEQNEDYSQIMKLHNSTKHKRKSIAKFVYTKDNYFNKE